MTTINSHPWTAFADILVNSSILILVSLLVLSWGWVFHLVGRKAAHALGRRRLIYECWAAAFLADHPRQRRVSVRRMRRSLVRRRPSTPVITRSLSSRHSTSQNRIPNRTSRS